MALDHYVSQVHLRQFYSPIHGKHMYGTKKSDLKSFPCRSEDVCRIEEWNTNAYLANDREIEDFLRGIEPKYNASLTKLRQGQVDQECVRVIGGFAAFVASCTPAAMRLYSKPLQDLLTSEINRTARRGVLSRAPGSLGRKTLPELLAEGAVRIDVDRKATHAIAVETIVSRVSIWGNSQWEVLRNNTDFSFFSSDAPVALEEKKDGSGNSIIPLAPDLAIRIIPDLRLRNLPPDLSFARFSYSSRTPAQSEIIDINRLIVRCAEDKVFYSNDLPHLREFIAENRNYRVEAVTKQILNGTRSVAVRALKIVDYRQAS